MSDEGYFWGGVAIGVNKYGECETCAQSDKRYCIGCQRMLSTDGTYTRTGWIAKPSITMTVTSLQIPTTENWVPFQMGADAHAEGETQNEKTKEL